LSYSLFSILFDFASFHIIKNNNDSSLADGIDWRLSVALRPPVLYRLDVIRSVVHQQQELRVFLLQLQKKQKRPQKMLTIILEKQIFFVTSVTNSIYLRSSYCLLSVTAWLKLTPIESMSVSYEVSNYYCYDSSDCTCSYLVIKCRDNNEFLTNTKEITKIYFLFVCLP